VLLGTLRDLFLLHSNGGTFECTSGISKMQEFVLSRFQQSERKAVAAAKLSFQFWTRCGFATRLQTAKESGSKSESESEK